MACDVSPVWKCPNGPRPPGRGAVGPARSRLRGLLVESPVDFGYLVNPALPFAVLQRKDLFVRPVKVKGDVRYLLVEPL
jgi:hypothetical protein